MTSSTDRFRTNFNGDGNSFGDVLLYTDGGAAAIWLMNENVRLGDGTNLPFNGPTWHVIATVDFDRVGPKFSDILWQNDNGALALWQMQGTEVGRQTNLSAAAPHVLAVNDFDGDGAADILFEHESGNPQPGLDLWTFSFGAPLHDRVIIGDPGPLWHAAASGDFDGDGKAGILFQRSDD